MLRCKQTFRAAVKDGPTRVVAYGELIDPKDPIVKGREELFETLEEYAARTAQGPYVRRGRDDAPVEQATANPGEKRATRRPKKQTDA